MSNILETISSIGIVPVIKIDNAANAVPLARALVAGGIPCAEITFRTSEGVEAISRISKEVPDCLVGAGTVLTTEQVDKAIAVGAKFVVSPGFNSTVVAYAMEKGIPVFPGCSSPSDMEKAIEMGLDVVKFFPAEQSGGLAYIKAVSAPYPMLQFMPTGGINADNISGYLSFDKIVACGGSWMVKSDLINDGKYDEISRLCSEAIEKMLGFELRHIGINTNSPDEIASITDSFEAMFGFAKKIGNSSDFAGQYIEVMKTKRIGTHGHIAIATNDIVRAKAYLERRGYSFNLESANLDSKGKLVSIYLQDEVGGFAIHLLRK
jgi:Entner-Doudoroff aldolase